MVVIKCIIACYVFTLMIIIADYIIGYIKYYTKMDKYIKDTSLIFPYPQFNFENNEVSRWLCFVFSPLVFPLIIVIVIDWGFKFLYKRVKILNMFSIKKIIEKKLFKKHKALVVTHPDAKIRKFKDQYGTRNSTNKE